MVNYVTKKRETKSQRGGLCMDEDEARYYFLQLLSAVEYCHVSVQGFSLGWTGPSACEHHRRMFPLTFT